VEGEITQGPYSGFGAKKRKRTVGGKRKGVPTKVSGVHHGGQRWTGRCRELEGKKEAKKIKT